MNESTTLPSRRQFIKTTGRIAAVSAFAGMSVPYVHAAGNDTIQLALIGCGGRGTGAVSDAMATKFGSVKLVAMADVFPNRLHDSYESLKREHGDAVDVPEDRRFIGFDGYQKAMDCLKPGDIVILTTPLAFRWVHFPYAIEKRLHVFMEKPLSADGPSSRKMLALSDQATAKNLKVGVGLMSRHSRAIQECAKRAHDGELGEIILMRGYRMFGIGGVAFSTKWPGNPNELLWQISRFHSFIWASGGLFNDFYIHIVDHLCMVKNAWPVSCQAIGACHYKKTHEGQLYVDQNFDNYSVEYTFADGCKMFMDGRCIDGAKEIYSSYAHGSKGMAVVSASGDCGFPSSIHSRQLPTPGNMLWNSRVAKDEMNPYVNEWNDLINAIRSDTPYNECRRGVEASVVCNMGRMAAHSGQEISFDEALNQVEAYAPDADKFTMDSPPPLRSNADGIYPLPKPGQIGKREYEIS